MNVIMTSDCISLFKRSLEENSRDLAEISHMDITSRKTLLRELESLMGLLKDTCRNNLGEQVYSSAVSNFQLAIARISLSIRNENLNGSDPETRGITNMFTAKEYDAISNLEKFSRIDMMSSDDICSILMNEDDRIYYLIKDWCTENMASLMGSMGKEKDPDIRGFIYGAMDEKYKLRLQKINEGVVKYLQKEPDPTPAIFRESKIAKGLLILSASNLSAFKASEFILEDSSSSRTGFPLSSGSFPSCILQDFSSSSRGSISFSMEVRSFTHPSISFFINCSVFLSEASLAISMDFSTIPNIWLLVSFSWREVSISFLLDSTLSIPFMEFS